MISKKNMMKNFVIFLLSITLGLYLYKEINDAMVNGKRSEVILVLNAFSTAQLTHFREYKKFTKDRGELGYTSNSENVEVYFEEGNIPEQFKLKIKTSCSPFVGDKAFRLMGLYHISNDRIEVWAIENGGKAFFCGFASP